MQLSIMIKITIDSFFLQVVDKVRGDSTQFILLIGPLKNGELSNQLISKFDPGKEHTMFRKLSESIS